MYVYTRFSGFLCSVLCRKYFGQYTTKIPTLIYGFWPFFGIEIPYFWHKYGFGPSIFCVFSCVYTRFFVCVDVCVCTLKKMNTHEPWKSVVDRRFQLYLGIWLSSVGCDLRFWSVGGGRLRKFFSKIFFFLKIFFFRNFFVLSKNFFSKFFFLVSFFQFFFIKIFFWICVKTQIALGNKNV